MKVKWLLIKLVLKRDDWRHNNIFIYNLLIKLNVNFVLKTTVLRIYVNFRKLFKPFYNYSLSPKNRSVQQLR